MYMVHGRINERGGLVLEGRPLGPVEGNRTSGLEEREDKETVCFLYHELQSIYNTVESSLVPRL